MRGCLSTIAVLVLLFAAIAGFGTWYLNQPVQARQPQTFFELERGMSSQVIARQLVQAGLIRAPYAFLAARVLHPRAALQAGEYQFGSQQSVLAIFDKFRRGQIFYEELTVPEGSNKFDIARLLQNSDTVKSEAFLQAAADPALIRDLDPQAPSLEGYLFPSTYRVTHKTTAKQLCAAMVAEFRRRWRDLHGVEAHRTVTLASLIEKESAVPAERPLIAAVFDNRLRGSMPLQCDPTVVYAAQLAHRYNGVIHKSDLSSPDPYNTYTNAGLPPGPIANPGSTSLQAALQPASVNYLYFVALPNGQGAHHFSASLAEHERAVAEYRRSRPAE